MKRQILLLAITAAALSSCTTAYKTGQTPDDVYFSPARPQDEYVRVEEKEEYRYDDKYYDDRYLRMKVHNRTRWDILMIGILMTVTAIVLIIITAAITILTLHGIIITILIARNNVIIYHPGTSVAHKILQSQGTFNIAAIQIQIIITTNNNVKHQSI